MKHRETKSAHEESVLDSFVSYLDAQGQFLQIVERPDPPHHAPDAIVKIDEHKFWIEITDAFQSTDWARSMFSYAADDKTHQPYKSRLICEPDQEACGKVQEVILKKYRKSTMGELLSRYGQGILLVGAYTPLTSPEEIVEQTRENILTEISNLKPIFQSIYLYRNTQTGHAFTKLL